MPCWLTQQTGKYRSEWVEIGIKTIGRGRSISGPQGGGVLQLKCLKSTPWVAASYHQVYMLRAMPYFAVQLKSWVHKPYTVLLWRVAQVFLHAVSRCMENETQNVWRMTFGQEVAAISWQSVQRSDALSHRCTSLGANGYIRLLPGVL